MEIYKVSVIVPIYNVEKYLRRAVDSLLAQTLKEIEIILVDDGSPDNCPKIIDDYAEKYENVVAVHKENGGLSDARNVGMAVAKGEFIGMLDPDDYAEPNMFELLYKNMISHNSDLSICGYIEEFSTEYKLERTIDLSESGKTVELIQEFIAGHFGAYAWNKLLRKDIIENHYLKYPIGIPLVEDCTFLCDYLRYADTFSVENNCLYHYIRNDSSICAKYHDRQFEYYRFGNEAKKKLIGTLDEDQREALFEENDKKYLYTCFSVLDQLNAFTNKQKLKSRYEAQKRIVSDKEFIELAKKFGLSSNDKTLAKKSKWVCGKQYFRLFIHENWKQRVVARINYYIK